MTGVSEAQANPPLGMIRGAGAWRQRQLLGAYRDCANPGHQIIQLGLALAGQRVWQEIPH
jgi:hypothetical protein